LGMWRWGGGLWLMPVTGISKVIRLKIIAYI
jgi:hypothetical protein